MTIATRPITNRSSALGGALGTGRDVKVLQLATCGITFKALLHPLVDRLQENGFTVQCACSDDPHTREMMERGYSITPIQIERKISPLSNLRSLWRLYRFMRRERFDIVHVHTPVAAVLGRIAAKMAGVPVIIYTAHGFFFHENMRKHVRSVVVMVEKILGRLATNRLLTQSMEDAETAVEEGICAADRVHWISNGVNVRAFTADPVEARLSLGLSPDDLVVGFVGRMVGEKGIVELVQAMASVRERVPRAKLLLVGDTFSGDWDTDIKGILREMIQANGLTDHIVMPGYLEDVPKAMAAMDLFVLPSYREGMPRTVIEAMASGKPVVATDIRGCREEVIDGVTGRLVPPRDAASLADAIVEVLSDPAKASAMGEAGRQRAFNHFDEEMVLEREIDIYRQLLVSEFGVQPCL